MASDRISAQAYENSRSPLFSVLPLILLFCFAPFWIPDLHAADSNYRMIYEVNYFDWMENAAAQFTVEENVAPLAYQIEILRHRRDIAASGDTVRLDRVVTHAIDCSSCSSDSLANLFAASIDSIILRSEVGFKVVKLEGQDTIAGLPSDKYTLNDGEGVKYHLWLAELPTELSHYNELAAVSFKQRRSTFLMFEFERQLIRQMLLSGAAFPNPGKSGRDFLVTRFETAKQFGFALSKGNTMSVEMRSFLKVPTTR